MKTTSIISRIVLDLKHQHWLISKEIFIDLAIGWYMREGGVGSIAYKKNPNWTKKL